MLERLTVGKETKAAFAVNKCEREEVIAMRKKMIEIQCYLQKNGLSMASFERYTMLKDREFNLGAQDSSQLILGRDEFGLHTVVNKIIPSNSLPRLTDEVMKDANNSDEDGQQVIQMKMVNKLLVKSVY